MPGKTLLTAVCVIWTGAAGWAGEGMRPVPIARVGYIRADAHPESQNCQDFNPTDVIAWDYGNRSIVIELEEARWVSNVVLASDTETGHELKLSQDSVSVYHSLDNKAFSLYAKPFELKITPSPREGVIWRVEFADLGFYARYIKLKQTYNGPDNGFATSNLAGAAQVLAEGPLSGSVSMDGLVVALAQQTGRLAAHVLISAPRLPGIVLELEAENTETWVTATGTARFNPGDWTRVTLESDKLDQGAYWLTARLVYRDQLLARRTTTFRVHAQALADPSGARDTTPAGGSVVLRNLARGASGGEPFSYALPHKPRVEFTGTTLAQGESVSLDLPISGQCAAYISVANPWPNLDIRWGDSRVTVPYTQADWGPTANTQEVFAGYSGPDAGALVIEAAGGPVKLFYVRLAHLTPDETGLAQYQTDPANNRHVIYNNDGFSELWGVKDWDRARLLELVERYQDTDAEIFEMAAFVSGVVNFPSEHATFWRPDDALIQGQWLRNNDKMAIDLFNQLEADGIPIFPTLARRGRELGISVFGSLRMSAYYPIREHQTAQPFNGTLWHEHPQMRIRRRDGKHNTQMSYAWEAVRRQRIGVLGEMAQMGCEGVMMDFCRYPNILGYDEPLVEGFKAKYGMTPLDLPDDDERWIDHRCDVMNDFFREVRSHIDEIGRKQGRQIRISVRVPATGYKAYGFDPETWARERLMDIFIPHYPSLEKDFDVRPWVAMAKPNGIKVYPGMTPTKTQTSTTELTDAQKKAGVQPGKVTSMTRDDYRRKAWRRYRNGADGTFLFNTWRIGNTRNILGDRRSLAKWSYFEDPMNLPRQDVLVSEP